MIGHATDDARRVADAVEAAVHREDKRDIATDPLAAIEELETIGWTAVSTAQSDPDAGGLTIYSLRDILARWSAPPDGMPDEAPAHDGTRVVYVDDVIPKLLNAFESLGVSASESMQHQTLAEILRTFHLLFDWLPAESQLRVEDMILRILSGLGDHVLTLELETALADLVATLAAAGRHQTADAILAAKEQLARSIGKLGNRSTRIR